MAYDSRSRLEAALARAHRQLWNAAQVAQGSRDHGLVEDLEQLTSEVERIQMCLLKGQGSLRTRQHART
jgi:hypothetical protein